MPSTQSLARRRLGAAGRALGRDALDTAERRFGGAVRAAIREEDREALALALMGRSRAKNALGRHQDAEDDLAAALRLDPSPRLAIRLHVERGALLLTIGDYVSARSELKLVIDGGSAAGVDRASLGSFPLVTMGEAYLDSRAHGVAAAERVHHIFRSVSAAADLPQVSGDRSSLDDRGWAYLVRARLALSAGDQAEALADAEAADTVWAASAGAVLERAHVKAIRGESLLGLGDVDAARALLLAAREIFHRYQLVPAAAAVATQLARCLRSGGSAPSERLGRRILHSVVSDLLAMRQLGLQFDDEARRVKWNRARVTPLFRAAVGLSVATGDTRLTSELIAVSRGLGALDLVEADADGLEMLDAFMLSATAQSAASARQRSPSARSAISHRPMIAPATDVRRHSLPELRMPDGRIALHEYTRVTASERHIIRYC